MLIKKHIVVIFFLAFKFPCLLHSQSTNLEELSRQIQELQTSNLKRKNENVALLKEFELIKRRYSRNSSPDDSLAIEISRLQRLDGDRQKQLETLLTIAGNTSSQVGNKLDAISLLLGVVGLILSGVGAFLWFYISKKEKKISGMLEEQRRIEEKVTKDLKKLYTDLREEELKDIFEKIDNSPGLISIHASRLLTIDLREEHFIKLKNLFLKWRMHKNFSNENWADYVTVLISHFPSYMATNQELLPIINRGLSIPFRYIMIEKIISFLEKLMEDFFENKYPEVGNHLLEVISALSEVFNPNYVATQMLFETITDKNNRFKLYNLIKTRPILIADITYKNLMIKAYSDLPENMEQENEALREMRESLIPPSA